MLSRKNSLVPCGTVGDPHALTTSVCDPPPNESPAHPLDVIAWPFALGGIQTLADVSDETGCSDPTLTDVPGNTTGM